MGFNRTDEEGMELNGRRDDTPAVAQTLRAVADAAQAPTDAKPGKKDDEKLSIFWRVFGGTILSIAALVVITLFNNVTSTLAELRSDLNKANEARANAVAELRTEIAKTTEARADLVRKDEFDKRLATSWDRVQALQQQNNAQNATLTSLKTEIDGLKERLTKSAADLDGVKKDAGAALEGLKKDQAAATDTIKKDVAAVEVVKERLAALAADVKSARDDLLKVRGELERNQSYDNERKERRDTQYKQVGEAIKELQKGLQDCREKLARLEGQYDPPTPPKKGSSPRPPAPKSGPDDPEPAPAPSAVKPPSGDK